MQRRHFSFMWIIFLKQISVIMATQDEFGIESPLVEVDLMKLGTQIAVRPYDLSVSANVGNVLVKEMLHGGDGAPLHLVSTPADIDILALKFIKVRQAYL